jgi:hypothetical protein
MSTTSAKIVIQASAEKLQPDFSGGSLLKVLLKLMSKVVEAEDLPDGRYLSR